MLTLALVVCLPVCCTTMVLDKTICAIVHVCVDALSPLLVASFPCVSLIVGLHVYSSESATLHNSADTLPRSQIPVLTYWCLMADL